MNGLQVIGVLAVLGFFAYAIWTRDKYRPNAAADPAPRPNAHRILKWALGLWAIAYPVVACSPMLASGGSAGGTAATGLASIVVGAALFGPWIVGIIVLAVLVYVTK